ncbi:MAG: transcriptional repressor, partial [Actinomycetaceae bacterium]|nr:transcriptional repressor [Actinomycetaceae bacterium]
MATDFVSRLHDAGLRVTEQRLAALAEVEKHGHISAEDLRQRVANKTGSISTQAIYDIVHTLTGVGILREIKPNGSVAL